MHSLTPGLKLALALLVLGFLKKFKDRHQHHRGCKVNTASSNKIQIAIAVIPQRPTLGSRYTKKRAHAPEGIRRFRRGAEQKSPEISII